MIMSKFEMGTCSINITCTVDGWHVRALIPSIVSSNFRGVARTVVMYRHWNETVGFTEANSTECGVGAGRGRSLPQGRGGGPGSKPRWNFWKIRTYLRYFQDQIYRNWLFSWVVYFWVVCTDQSICIYYLVYFWRGFIDQSIYLFWIVERSLTQWCI